MGKIYTAMGLMSGTSLDGVDVSIIKSDGYTEYSSILDRYFEYNEGLINKILELRDKISSSEGLTRYLDEIKALEREITLFHFNAVSETLKKTNLTVDLIGFHGQTIFHEPEKKISKQLGDGNLLSQLTKKKVVYNFRQNDLKNGGQGAPLTPIFHKMLVKKLNFKSATFINIGGIINETSIFDDASFQAHDLGPGMCLIDKWIRTNSKKRYDDKGNLAMTGKINQKIFDNAVRNWMYTTGMYTRKSLDVREMESFFDYSSLKKLTLEDVKYRIEEFYDPYHQRLDLLLKKLKALFGRAVLLDCHSMPTEAIKYNRRSNDNIPDIILGDRFGMSCGIKIIDFLEAAFVEEGFKVCRNIPFSGGYITQLYGQPSKNIHAVQVEISRALYMDEKLIRKNPDFNKFCESMKNVIFKITEIDKCFPEFAIAAE